jgi:hypothetical protein
VTTGDGLRFVGRDAVSSIAERAVRLGIDAGAVGRLDRPEGSPTYTVDPTEGAGPSLRDRLNRLFRRGRWKRVS